MNHSEQDQATKVYEALKPHLTPLESESDIVGAGLDVTGPQYAVKVYVRELRGENLERVQAILPSPLTLTLDDGETVILPVNVVEGGQPRGQ